VCGNADDAELQGRRGPGGCRGSEPCGEADGEYGDQH
jgi:hypothetical protein